MNARAAVRNRAKHAWCVALGIGLMLSAAAFAEGQTYTGLMIPNSPDAVVPITVTMEKLGGKFKGKLTSPPPFGGEGLFLADVRNIHQCEFTTNIGVGRTLMFDGFCLPNTIEGNYALRFSDGTIKRGYLQAKREEVVRPAEKPRSEAGGQPLFSVTTCLTANSACLAACPHGDYNAEFVCSNRCRQKLVACKNKANATSAGGP